jgi:ketosteroid isomerase-like protein
LRGLPTAACCLLHIVGSARNFKTVADSTLSRNLSNLPTFCSAFPWNFFLQLVSIPQTETLKEPPMRELSLIIGLLTAVVSPVFAQTAPRAADQNANIEQSVLQLTRDWLAAEERHDRATLQRIIADDFQGTAPMGNAVFKEDVLPMEGAQSGGLSINTSELKARVFGDTAVVTARGVQKSGEKRELRFTIVFAKRDDHWQMVAGHLSAVPKE